MTLVLQPPLLGDQRERENGTAKIGPAMPGTPTALSVSENKRAVLRNNRTSVGIIVFIIVTHVLSNVSGAVRLPGIPAWPVLIGRDGYDDSWARDTRAVARIGPRVGRALTSCAANLHSTCGLTTRDYSSPSPGDPRVAGCA